MNARGIMTEEVVSASPEMSMREIAELLLAKGISAVPVVDESGAPIGMVSEGDLIGRDEADREARRDWWLTLLAEGEALNPEFLASLHGVNRTAREIMSVPVVTIGEDADVVEIARLLTAHRIKRVPVVHDGRMVGIVSRADLLRAVAAGEAAPAAPQEATHGGGLLARLNHRYHLDRRGTSDRKRAAPRPASEEGRLTVADFRALVEDFQHEEARHQDELRRAAAEERRAKVAELIEHHISDQGWRTMLHEAREVAERGAKEFMLLRFPSALCSDGGRAVNAPEPNWPATLRGEAAEIYLRWEHDLKPRGFHLAARVLDFPGGFPGDIGLFLMWGE